MKAQDFDPARLDVEAFAKAGSSMQGAWPVSSLERLAASVVAGTGSGDVVWHADGEHRAVRGGRAEIWLHLKASVQVMLECQRCLAPVSAGVSAARSFMFVHGESTAAELDAESEDDVLAVTRALDLRALIEDELLLEMPLVPRHEVCPAPLVVEAEPDAADEHRPNPFAVLAALKRGDLPN
jgi:uncharacterized protein